MTETPEGLAEEIVNRYERVSDLVFQERLRQIVKWGWPQNNSLPIWMTVLGEEYGETCQEVLRVTYGGKSLDDFVAEMVQVAAVAIAALEDLEEQGLIDLSDMISNVISDVDGAGMVDPPGPCKCDLCKEVM